jgi:hypothetical protein
MPIKKRLDPTAANSVLRVFDRACMVRLAKIARLPAGADKARFTDSVRIAALIYARDARKPSATDVRKEIEDLHRAAARRNYDHAAALADSLSPETLRLIERRAEMESYEDIVIYTSSAPFGIYMDI